MEDQKKIRISQQDQQQQGNISEQKASLPPGFLQRLRVGRSASTSASSLLASLASSDWRVRAAAISALGAEPSALELLARAMQDEHESVRAAAARALGKLGRRAPLGFLLLALHDSSWLVRASAAQALGKLGQRVPPEPLTRLLHDDDEAVRAAAAGALGAIGNPAAIDALLTILHDPAWHVRETAALALVEFGPDAPVSDLAVVLHDDEAPVREALLSLRESHPDLFEAVLTSANDLDNPRGSRQPFHRRKRRAAAASPRPSWLTGKGTLTRRAALGGIATLIIAGNGLAWSLLAQNRRDTITAARPARGTLLRTYRGHRDGALTLAWSPDSTFIASGGNDSTVQVWETTTGQHLRTYQGHTQAVSTVAWAPDGTYIASGSSDATIQVWQASTGQTITTYRGHPLSILDLAWSPDGNYIVSSANDGSVQVWEALSGKRIASYQGRPGSVTGVAWSPDASRIAAINQDNYLWVREALRGTRLLVQIAFPANSDLYDAPSGGISWSPDSKRLAYGNSHGKAQVIAADTGEVLSTFRDPGLTNTLPSAYASVGNITWSPDASLIASASGNKTVQVWEAATSKPLFACHSGSPYIFSTAWSPDGTRIASACWDDGAVLIWKAS